MSLKEREPDSLHLVSPLMKDIFFNVGEFLDNNHFLTEMSTPDRHMLGFPTTTHEAKDNKRHFEDNILAEMQAFLPTVSMDLSTDSHGEQVRIVVGSTTAADPHTFLTLPAEQVLEKFRDKIGWVHFEHEGLSVSMESMTELGFPENQPPKYLPMHSLTWIILQIGEKAFPLDALGLLSGNSLLDDLGITMRPDQLELILHTFDQYTHLNALAMTDLYQTYMCPAMVGVVEEMRDEIGLDASWNTDRVWQNFTLEHKGITRFVNIGHHLSTDDLQAMERLWPKFGRDQYATGRGPASQPTMHSFSRIVPHKRFLRMLDGVETVEEKMRLMNVMVKKLLAKLGGWQPHESQNIFNYFDPFQLAATEPERFVKTLDPFGRWEGQEMLQSMANPLEKAFLAIDPTLVVSNIEDVADSQRPYSRHINALSFTFAEHTPPEQIMMALKAVLLDVQLTRMETLENLIQTDGQEPATPNKQAILGEDQRSGLANDQLWKKKLEAYQPTRLMTQVEISSQAVSEVVSQQEDSSFLDKKREAKLYLLQILLSVLNDAELEKFVQEPILGFDLNQLLLEPPSDQSLSKERLYLWEMHSHYPIVLESALRSVHKLLSFGLDQNSKFDHKRAIQVLVTQFLEVERLGSGNKGRRPMNAPIIPGFLFSYNYIDSPSGKRLHVVLSPVGNESSSVEQVKSLVVRRMVDKNRS